MRSLDRPSVCALLLVLAQAVLVAACFGFALSLPFFWDDVPHYLWLDRTDLSGVWTHTVSGLNYYRPIPFTIWKVFSLVRGDYDAAAFHAINLGLHTLNACVLGLIVYGLALHRKTLTALAAATLFTLFPFAFQAIVPVNSLTHPAHTFLILSAALAFQTYLKAHRSWLLVCSVVLAGGSIFAHENGALAPALITLTALCQPARLPLRRVAIATTPFWVAAVVGLLIWRSVPRGVDPLPLGNVLTQWESRLQNAALFAQGFAYPFTAFGPALRNLGLANDLITVALLTLPACALWLALASWKRQAWWGLLWFMIAVAPALLLLDFNYVLESPRLMYLASAGAAAFWAMPLGLIEGRSRWSRARLTLAGALVIAASAWGFVYTQRRADLYRLLGQSIQQAHLAGTEADCANGGVANLVINFPEWFFVRQPEYVLGHDGIKTVSEGEGLDELMWINYRRQAHFEPVALSDIQPADTPFKSLGEAYTQDGLAGPLRRARSVLVASGDEQAMRVTRAGCFTNASMSDVAQHISFDQRLALTGAMLTADATNPRQATLALEWHARAPITDDVTVFVHVVDGAGALVAQADGYPIAGASPMRTWRAGDRWRDERAIALNQNAVPGNYRVITGLYRTGDGARLAATDASGQHTPDDAVEAGVLRMP